jgi:hypothetical protein
MTVDTLATFMKEKQCCSHSADAHQTVFGHEALPGHVPSACWDVALEHKGQKLDVKTWCVACHGEEHPALKMLRIEFPSISF